MLDAPIDQLLPPPDEGDDPTAADLRRQESLQLFGERLDALFRRQVADKSLIEERWLSDTQQYNGEYAPDVLARIKESGGSEAFLNLTRVKCNATESRLSEMLLPTDDRNWAIEPTPMPDMPDMPGSLAGSWESGRDDGNQGGMPPGMDAGAPPGMPPGMPGQPPQPAAGDPEAAQIAAKKASDRMQRIMEDQLAECGYNAILRSVLHNMTTLGTGVLKGPVIRNRLRQRFKKLQGPADPETGIAPETWAMVIDEDLAPGAESVSPWDFFPDMRAARMEDAEFVFQRHRLNKSKLRDLAKLPGFMPAQIAEVLSQEPSRAWAGSVSQADSADKHQGTQAGYEVIEYHGPLEPEDLVAVGLDVDVEDRMRAYQGTVWFCDRRVLKATLSMLDSQEIMYDVVPLERDDTTLFGFGVPYLMRHSQRAGNAAWRMVLDNARLSVGGQVVYKKGKIRPVNGDYRLHPLKSWEMTDPNGAIADVFGIVPIATNFQEMFRILESVRQFQDEETGLPQIAQGQQSPAITKTAQGMSILMNSANTVLRRMVKEFDDAITARFIRRLYQWNMQYGDDDEAKGDYTVLALGSSSLMVREQQSQGLMQLAQLAGANPEFAQRTKWGDLYRTIVKSLNINADGLIKSDEDLQAEQQDKQPETPPELQIEMAKLEMAKAELQVKQAESQAEIQIKQAQAQSEAAALQAKTQAERERAQMAFEADRMRALASVEAARADMARVQVDRELALLKLAAEREMTMAEVRKEFGIAAMNIESKHELFNAERAIKDRFGQGL